MAKERLSKLQKWILAESYKLNILHDGSVVGRKSSSYYRLGIIGYKRSGEDLTYQYFECWIYEKYYGFDGNTSSATAYNRVRVAVCRTVRNMEQKGLIYVNHYLSRNVKNWRISEKGVALLKKCRSGLFEGEA